MHLLPGGDPGRVLVLTGDQLADLLVVTAYTMQRSTPGSELRLTAQRLRAAINHSVLSHAQDPACSTKRDDAQEGR